MKVLFVCITIFAMFHEGWSRSPKKSDQAGFGLDMLPNSIVGDAIAPGSDAFSRDADYTADSMSKRIKSRKKLEIGKREAKERGGIHENKPPKAESIFKDRQKTQDITGKKRHHAQYIVPQNPLKPPSLLSSQESEG